MLVCWYLILNCVWLYQITSKNISNSMVQLLHRFEGLLHNVSQRNLLSNEINYWRKWIIVRTFWFLEAWGYFKIIVLCSNFEIIILLVFFKPQSLLLMILCKNIPFTELNCYTLIYFTRVMILILYNFITSWIWIIIFLYCIAKLHW